MCRIVTPAGDRLITDDGDGVAREWDAATHQHIRTLPAPNARSASPAGRSL